MSCFYYLFLTFEQNFSEKDKIKEKISFKTNSERKKKKEINGSVVKQFIKFSFFSKLKEKVTEIFVTVWSQRLTLLLIQLSSKEHFSANKFLNNSHRVSSINSLFSCWKQTWFHKVLFKNFLNRWIFKILNESHITSNVTAIMNQ